MSVSINDSKVFICSRCKKPRNKYSKKYGTCVECGKNIRRKFLQEQKGFKKCECDDPNCQELIPKFTLNNEPMKFAHFHHNKGINHPYYKDRITQSHGYKIYRNFKHENKPRLNVGYHRVIYEQYYNCCLLPNIEIHHIDHNPKNNDISNLMPLPKRVHKTRKYRSKLGDPFCTYPDCKTPNETLVRKNGYHHWYTYNGNWICNRCYAKMRYRLKRKTKRE
jgi:hypothetical protein